MNHGKKRWQSVRKISFKKVMVLSPYENFLLSSYIDDLAKVCGKDGSVILRKGQNREATYYFSCREKGLSFFCRINCIKGIFSRMF